MESATPTLIVLKELAGNPPPELNAMQELLLPYTDVLTMFWISVWIVTAALVARHAWYEYKKHAEARG